MVISIASLINGQDLLSSIISFSIIILIVVNMYLIQQKEIMDFNFKNILKYLGFGLSIFPIIIIFYLIFPRAEVDFRLFNTSKGSLGIPDTINNLVHLKVSLTLMKKYLFLLTKITKKKIYISELRYLTIWKRINLGGRLHQFSYIIPIKIPIKVKSFDLLDEKYEIILEPYKEKMDPFIK